MRTQMCWFAIPMTIVSFRTRHCIEATNGILAVRSMGHFGACFGATLPGQEKNSETSQKVSRTGTWKVIGTLARKHGAFWSLLELFGAGFLEKRRSGHGAFWDLL